MRQSINTFDEPIHDRTHLVVRGCGATWRPLARPMLLAPSAPRLLPTLGPLANAGLATFMLPTSLLPEFSSPDFSLSMLPATLSTQSCFLGEPVVRGALLRGTTSVASRDPAVISAPEPR